MNRAVLAALVSLTLAGAVRAQDTADDAKKAAVLEEARQHVAKAKVHYDLGEFKEAADEYIQVYRLRPIAAILFNVAQAYRQGGMYEKARQFYKSYLRESPNAANKGMIEQSIREMDDLLAKEKRTREAAPTGVKEPAEASLPVTPVPAPAPSAVPSPASKKAEPPAQTVAVAPSKPSPVPEAHPSAPALAKPSAPAATKPPVAATTPRPEAPTAATHSTPVPAAAVEEDDPLYKKWWLWTAVGVVAIGAGAAAMTLGGNSPPSSHFGTTPVFP
jgi:tetratricopeptide (TPR) repeat protein